MKANRVTNKVYLINRPVSSTDGSPVAFIPPRRGHNTGTGYSERGGNIASVSVDGALSRLAHNQPVALIKIDVEGYEMEVLHGASRTIAQWRPIVVVETKTPEAYAQIDRHMTAALGYSWAGRYCATPTQLYKP